MLLSRDEILTAFKNNLVYLRLSFFYAFVLRIGIIFLLWGSILDYLNTVDWKLRLLHYFILYLSALFFVQLFKNKANKCFFIIVKKFLFFSIDYPFSYKFNKHWLYITSVVAMPFICIISFNYLVATFLFLLASVLHSEIMVELLFLSLFLRILFTMILLGPRFLLLEDALAFYQKASLNREKSVSVDFSLPSLPAPMQALAYSANLVIFRPFLSSLSYLVRYAIRNFIKFDDYRKPIFYSSFFVFPPFRLMPGFLLHEDIDFTIAYFRLQTLNLFTR